MRKFLVIAAAAILFPAASYADVITFGPGAYGSPVTLTVEGIFQYNTFSGGLFRDSQGNGDAFDMEGCSVCGGGVLTIKRNDVAGGLFQFNSADIALQFDTVYPIVFRGYVGNVLVASDSFNTLAGSIYKNVLAAALGGLAIDELRIQLDANQGFAAVVDNVNLTARVPEPTTLALFGTVLAGLAIRRRGQSRR
jgi:hypothetical protein